MDLVIIAGGIGKRLALKDIPKPMVDVCGKPLLEYQIDLAKRHGVKNIFLLTSYLSKVITDHFGDGNDFGVNIKYILDKHPLGTAGAVKQLEGVISERFMVFYGDVFIDMDLNSFIEYDANSKSVATIAVHPNDHPYDSDLVEINDENVVTAFHPKPRNRSSYYGNMVNAAVYILSPDIYGCIPNDRQTDFGKDIFPLILKNKGTIRVYKTAEYIKDVGTPDRIKKVSSDYLSGRTGRFAKRKKRPSIFLDRDGTLIEHVSLLHKMEDLALFPFTSSAIKKINDSDYLCFLLTNQPVVARNLCDINTVKKIHSKVETLLGRDGAFINDIYFCPHHPDKGYPEENPIFKIECNCRKPKIGMVDKAVKEYNVDVKNSWMIGDTTMDIQTGVNAGMKTILVKTGVGGGDKKYRCLPDIVLDNLAEAVNFILRG